MTPAPIRPALAALAAVLALALGTAPARAAAELIVNGDFTTYTANGAASSTSYIVSGGQTSGSGGASLSSWSNAGYTFLFQPGTASNSGAVISGTTTLKLWGPEGGSGNAAYSNNGLSASPTGGVFLASDGAYQAGRITQTLNNLVIGSTYVLSFWWAAAQQAGYDGANTEGWSVYWGPSNSAQPTTPTFSTASVLNPNHGFTPWQQQVYQLTASATSMTLGFLATSGPNGSPPFSLLDGVSLVAAPEPASWALFGAGLVALAATGLRRRGTA